MNTQGPHQPFGPGWCGPRYGICSRERQREKRNIDDSKAETWALRSDVVNKSERNLSVALTIKDHSTLPYRPGFQDSMSDLSEEALIAAGMSIFYYWKLRRPNLQVTFDPEYLKKLTQTKEFREKNMVVIANQRMNDDKRVDKNGTLELSSSHGLETYQTRSSKPLGGRSGGGRLSYNFPPRPSTHSLGTKMSNLSLYSPVNSRHEDISRINAIKSSAKENPMHEDISRINAMETLAKENGYPIPMLNKEYVDKTNYKTITASRAASIADETDDHVRDPAVEEFPLRKWNLNRNFNPESGFISANRNPDSGFISANRNPDSGFFTANRNPDSGFVTANRNPDSGFVTANRNPDSGFVTANRNPDSGFITANRNPDSGFFTANRNPDLGFITANRNPDSGFVTANRKPCCFISMAMRPGGMELKRWRTQLDLQKEMIETLIELDELDKEGFSNGDEDIDVSSGITELDLTNLEEARNN